MLGAGLTALLVAGAAAAVYMWRWTRLKARLPPGPPPLPLLGNHFAIEKSGEKFLYEYFRRLVPEYGGVVTVWMGSSPWVVLNTADAFKLGLVKHGSEFAGRLQNATADLLSEGGRSVLFGDYSPTWLLHRKLAITAIRNYASKDKLAELVHDVMTETIDGLAAGGGRPTDVHDLMYRVKYSVLGLLVFGERLPGEDIASLTLQIRDLNEQFGQGIIQDSLPRWLWWVPSPGKTKLATSTAFITDYFTARVSRAKRAFDPDNVHTLLDFVIQAQRDAQARGEDMSKFTDVHLRQTVLDIFLAASDSVVYTIMWAILFMIKYPDIQTKIRQEVVHAVPNRMVTAGDRDKLPYTEAFIQETLRMRPIAPLSLQHVITADVTFQWNGQDYFLPKGTTVIPNIWGSQHDTSLWGEDHDAVRPERFLSPDGTKLIKREGMMTFSAGKRQCVGEQVAKPDLLFMLVAFVQRVKFKCPPGTPVPSLTPS